MPRRVAPATPIPAGRSECSAESMERRPSYFYHDLLTIGDIKQGAMNKMSRRALAQLAAAAAAALNAQQSQTGEYAGPLSPAEQKAAGRDLDPLPYGLRLLDAAPRQLRFSARTKPQAEQWQDQLRAKLTELLGGFPSEKAPLRPLLLETRDFPAYRREKILFDSRNGMSV